MTNDKDEKLTNAVPAQPEAETTSSEKKAEPASAEKKTPKKNIFRSKKFKYGGMSILLSVIFVVAVVLVNVVSTLAADKFGMKADLTGNSLYTIEDSTKDYLKTISDKVTVTITMKESDYTNAGTYYVQTNQIAKAIASANDNITLNYVDILTTPSFSANFTETLTQGQIVVQSENTKRYKILAVTDYLNVSYDSSYQQTVSGNAEQAITSAILSVTDTNPIKVAVISGYGETSNTVFEQLLTSNSYVLENVDITLTDSISEDYDFAFLFGSTSDYSNADITKIEKWLDNDGKFTKNLVYFASTSMGDCPNLDAFLAEWGIQVQKGTIYQTNTDYAYETRPTYQIIDIPESNYSDLNSQYRVFADTIMPVKQLWEANGNIETKVIAQSFDGAVLKPADADDKWTPSSTDTKGVLTLAVDSAKTRYEGSTPYSSHILAFGSMELLSSSFVSATQANNAQYMLNVFNTISGKGETISITPKSFDMTTFQIDATQKNIIVIIFAIIIPVVTIGSGIFIWVRRKHR